MKRSRPRLLITGAAGRIGTHIVPLLREHFALRLLDLKPLTPQQDDEVVQADIRDLDSLRQACSGVTALVHLAARADEDDFMTQLLPLNLVGVYNAFEAARQAGVRKVIFASTGQTIVGYPPETTVTPDLPVRPITVYACTKIFGEALARYYSDHHGMSAICLRLGWFQPYDSEILRTVPDILRWWVSPRDLAQMILKCLRADLPFAIFFAISDNPQRHWDITGARQLVGYEPEDNAADYYVGAAG